MNWVLVVAGALLALIGGIWALQGFGILPGSVMSGVPAWAIVGPIVAIGGLVLLGVGIARLRRASR